MDHLAEQSVLDLLAGRLAEPEVAPVHDHLDRCGECRALIATLLRGTEAATTGLGGAPAAGTPPPSGADLHVEGVAATRLDPRPTPAGGAPGGLDQLDEYRLIGLLGQGGMGTVYRAHDTLLDREVAIKLVVHTDSEAARQRFTVEARAVARIRHPNVVVVHRVGVAGDQLYIVYDLVRGITLSDLRPPIPWPKVLELATAVARGLAAAHDCGVLHRDIKPANLMIGDQGDVVLVDFGLAKVAPTAPRQRANDAASGAALAEATAARGLGAAEPAGLPSAPAPGVTATGAALGTPRYMAPEAWRGAEATPQTDLYSLGVVLYELLAGEPPFSERSSPALARRVCSEDAPPLAARAPWLPTPLASLVDRCLAREPGRRPRSAAALAEELEALQRGRAFEAFERDRVQRAPRGNPYPGAQPFGWEHQGVFFGRRAEVRALVGQLRDRPLVVVTGAPGVGKTSLCAAGVLPILLRGALGGSRKWVPVSVSLGGVARPLAALAGAIAGHVELPSDEVERRLATDPDPVLAKLRAGHSGGCTAHVLFVDALEALLVADPREARCVAEILGALARPAPALRVLATLRAEQLVAVAQLPGLAAVIGPAIYLLLELREEAALREIVVEPARLGGRALAAAVAEPLVAAAARGELGLGQLEARLAALWDAA